jgi:hypothetical protein
MDRKLPLVVSVKRRSTHNSTPIVTSGVKLARDVKAALSDTGWIGAIDALDLLATHFSDDESAKAELLLRLSQGRLTCRAACWCQEADRGKVDWHDIDWCGYKTSSPHDGQQEPTLFEEPAGEECRVSVPMDIFLTSNGWIINADEVVWKWGYFIGRKPVDLLTESTSAAAKNKLMRRFAYGLEFHLNEIGALIPLPASSKSSSTVQGENQIQTAEPLKGGRPTEEYKRTSMWLTLLEIALDNRLNKESFSSQEELRNEVSELTKEVIGHTLMKPYVAQVWKKFFK